MDPALQMGVCFLANGREGHLTLCKEWIFHMIVISV